MAPLPKIDFTAIKIRELLNHRKRDEAKALARAALSSGNAAPETQQLALELMNSKQGRPKAGKYKWMEIGHRNYWLEAEQISRRERYLLLLKEFPDVSDKHIEACITLYNSTLNA